jgi:hypothetical protein
MMRDLGDAADHLELFQEAGLAFQLTGHVIIFVILSHLSFLYPESLTENPKNLFRRMEASDQG